MDSGGDGAGGAGGDALIDALVTGLVREYLHRKGHTEVLRMFDDETVRGWRRPNGPP